MILKKRLKMKITGKVLNREKGGYKGGSRVKYLVATEGPNKDSVYSRSKEIEEFLFRDSLVDVDYYISNHIIPALDRVVGCIKKDINLHHWVDHISKSSVIQDRVDLKKIRLTKFIVKNFR